MNNTMFSSRRALLYHANSSIRFSLSRNNRVCVSTFSSIPHKNHYQVQVEGGTTPAEELSQVLKTSEGSEVDRAHGVTTSREKRHAPPVEEMVKAAAVGAMETGLKLGKIAKHTMDAMWEIAEKTTESVKDSVANDNDNAHRRPSDRTRLDNRSSDPSRKAGDGGYDWKYGR